jgi:hypothetical protein
VGETWGRRGGVPCCGLRSAVVGWGVRARYLAAVVAVVLAVLALPGLRSCTLWSITVQVRWQPAPPGGVTRLTHETSERAPVGLAGGYDRKSQ